MWGEGTKITASSLFIWLLMIALIHEYNTRTNPIEEAILSHNIEKLEATLANGANPDQPVENNPTALFWTVINNEVEMTRLLIAYNADVNYKNNRESYPLHYARSIDIAELLLNAGANVYAVNASNRTALDLAIKDLTRSSLIPFLTNRGGQSRSHP